MHTPWTGHLRWTRTTVATAAAAIVFVVVFAATLLLRPDARPATALTPPPAPTAASLTDDTAGGEDAAPEGGGSAGTSGGTVEPVRTTGGGPRPSATGHPEDTAAVETATTFLADTARMIGVPGPVERDGDRATVTVYARGEDGRTVEAVATVVSLRERDGRWEPTGASTATIAVDTPTPGAVVSSPVTVRGRAHAYEGTVGVTVVEDRTGRHTIVGEGFVTGAGDRMGPFSGEIPLVQHNSERGWVVFTEESAADGSTGRATIVPVAFADDVKPDAAEDTPAPTVADLTWSPDIPLRDGWLVLPAGPGELTVNVTVEHADRVELVITPTGTGTAPYARVLPMSVSDDGPHAVTWEYGDEAVLAHVGLRAVGPGGETNVDVFGVVTDA